MGNIVPSGFPYSVGELNSETNPYCKRSNTTPPIAPEAPVQGFPWLKGSVPSNGSDKMKLEILQAEVPAFFHEGYSVEPDATEDLLYKALCKQDEDRVKSLLQDPLVDVNDPLQCVSYTPLHIACEGGNLGIVATLKENGADLDLLSDGYSPLVTAARHGHARVVSYLLDNGTLINQKVGKEIISAFIKSSFLQDLKYRGQSLWISQLQVNRVVQELFDPYWGNTALIQACREHHRDIVRELLQNGGDTSTQNMAGNTALHVACLSRTANTHTTSASPYVPCTVLIGGDRDIVRQLLDAGADPDVRNANGETALERTFRLMSKSRDPLSMEDCDFSITEKLSLLRGALHVVRQLLIAGCDVRGGGTENQWLRDNVGNHQTLNQQNRSSNSLNTQQKSERDVSWTVSQLVRVCQLLIELDTESTLRSMYEDTLLLFYECVYISGHYFPWDELEAVVVGEQELDEDFRERLLSINCRLFSLAKCCRIVIRQYLHTPLCTCVTHLPVPADTQRYILFSDMDY